MSQFIAGWCVFFGGMLIALAFAGAAAKSEDRVWAASFVICAGVMAFAGGMVASHIWEQAGM